MSEYTPPNISPQENQNENDTTPDGEGVKLQAQKARAEYVQASARMKQIQLAQMEGTTADTQDIVNEYDRIISEVRAWMLILPRKLAVLIAPDDPFEAEKILSKEVNEVLESLAEGGDAWKKRICKKS